MSLLADLLSKIKQPQAKREVPPNLKNIVQSSSNKSSAKRKIILLSVILVVFVLAGIATLLFVDHIEQPSENSMEPASQAGRPAPVLQQAVQTAKNEVKTLQSGQTQKESDDSLSNAAVSPKDSSAAGLKTDGKIVKKAEAPAPGSYTWKPTSKVAQIAHALRRGQPSPGAWGKGTAQKQNETDQAVEDTVKTQAPSTQKEEKNTRQRDLHLYSARDNELRKDYSRALADYQRALEADNENISIMNSIAYIYLHLDIIDSSISHSQKALDINNEYVPALINMGIALAKQDKQREAESYFRSALGIDPDNQNVLLNLAVLFETQGMYEPSENYYGRLTKFGNIEGALGLARIYEKQGETDKAVQLYTKVYSNESIDEKTKNKVRQRIMRLRPH